MIESDRPFVFSSWLRGLKIGNDLYGQIDPECYEKGQTIVIEHILKQASTTIACLKEDKDVLLGYSVTRKDNIDWIYIKKLWRELGLAKELLKHITPRSCSHITFKTNKLRLKHKIIFNPFQ